MLMLHPVYQSIRERERERRGLAEDEEIFSSQEKGWKFNLNFYASGV
jgi:hypothetical protein